MIHIFDCCGEDVPLGIRGGLLAEHNSLTFVGVLERKHALRLWDKQPHGEFLGDNVSNCDHGGVPSIIMRSNSIPEGSHLDARPHR